MDEIESRKKLDEQRKKLQEELRDVGNSHVCPKEVQDSLKNDLQQQLQEVEQRRHDLMPEHKRYKASRIKEGICRKTERQLKRRCGRSERKSIEKEERFRLLSDKSIRTEWQMRKWMQNFRDGRQEKKEEVTKHRKTGSCCMEEAWQHLVALGANQMEALLQRLQRKKGAVQGWMPGKEEGRRNSENEQGQGRKKEKRNSQGKDPRTFGRNSQGKDTRTFQGRCHKEERWRIQEKKREGMWKKRRKKRRKKEKEKCKKSARTRWWSGIGKSFVSAFTRKRMEEEEEKKCRSKVRYTKGETRLGTMGKMVSSLFAAGAKHVMLKIGS